MSRGRYTRSKFTSWASQSAVHDASLFLAAAERLRALARGKRLPRVRSAEQLAAAMLLAEFEPQLVGLSQIIWNAFVERDMEDETHE